MIPPDKFAAGKGKLFTYEKKQSELCWILVNDATYITGKELQYPPTSLKVSSNLYLHLKKPKPPLVIEKSWPPFLLF